MTKLVILDRDGVINVDSKDFVKTPAEWIPIPGSLEAIAKLNQAGYQVVVATNQSGIARGLFDLSALNHVHKKMQQCLQAVGGHIDGLFFCPHGPLDACECRKPKPGLFKQIAQQFKLDFREQAVFAIGDSLRDLEAAFTAGANPVLVLTGNGTETAQKLPLHLKSVPQFKDLAAAIEMMV